MATLRPTCAFCGAPGSSNEDVFAKWIADVVKGGGPFNLDRAHGRSKTALRYLGLISRACCQTCNNGWMSRAEERAKPLLTPIIQDTPARWATDAEQTAVAAWTHKTALMLDRAGTSDRWTATDEHYRYLHDHGQPPPTVSIWLGRYVANPGETDWSVWADTSWMHVDRGHERDAFTGYRITFTVGHALFYTYGHTGGETDLVMPNLTANDQPVNDAFRRLWPLTRQAHDWPPQGAKFATSGLTLITRQP